MNNKQFLVDKDPFQSKFKITIKYHSRGVVRYKVASCDVKALKNPKKLKTIERKSSERGAFRCRNQNKNSRLFARQVVVVIVE